MNLDHNRHHDYHDSHNDDRDDHEDYHVNKYDFCFPQDNSPTAGLLSNQVIFVIITNLWIGWFQKA